VPLWKVLFWAGIPLGVLNVGFRGARYFAPGMFQACSRHGLGQRLAGRFQAGSRPAQRRKGKVVSLRSGAC